jgi:hypothetical protein
MNSVTNSNSKAISISNYNYDLNRGEMLNPIYSNGSIGILKRSETITSHQSLRMKSNACNTNRNSFIYSPTMNKLSNKDSELLMSSMCSSSSSSASSSSSSPLAIYLNNPLHTKTNEKQIALKLRNFNYNTLKETTSQSSSRNDKNIGYMLNKPIPPSRTSSLRNKNLMNKVIDDSSSIANAENMSDRNSIYSSFSLRYSRLSSFNINNNNNDTQSATIGNQKSILSYEQTFKIESCYQSFGSTISSSRCLAELYTTNLDGLIRLLDWKQITNGVPIWIFNTGLNAKRKKGLSLVIADQKSGFALWQLNNLTHINDLKWSKPGHLTFKVYQNNLNEKLDQSSGSCLPQSFSFDSKKIDEKKNSLRSKRFSLSSRSFRSSFSTNELGKFLQSQFSSSLASETSSKPYLFAAIKFHSEFECARFYDFYRNLSMNSQHDDLFNPHFLQNRQQTHQQSDKLKSKPNIIKTLCKKISKHSISSPCAFHHINSLSIVDEESNFLHTISDSQSLDESSENSDSY